MNQDRLRQVVNLVTLAVMITVNILANALPIAGRESGEISDNYPTLVTPAGYVFSIWGLIYIGLIAFGIYQALPSQRENPRLRRIGYWFAVANLANAGWLFLWHYELFAISILVMLILLTSLIIIYRRLQVGRVRPPLLERLTVDSVFSLYLGWISIATIANIAVTLTANGWDGFGIPEETWAAIMITIATILTIALVMTRSEFIYPAVIIWAFSGIIVNQQQAGLVVTFSAIGILVIGGAMLIRLATMLLTDHRPARVVRRRQDTSIS